MNVLGQVTIQTGIALTPAGQRALFGGIQAKIISLNPKSKVIQLSPISKISSL